MEDEFVYKAVRIPMGVVKNGQLVHNDAYDTFIQQLMEGTYRPPPGWRVVNFVPDHDNEKGGSFVLFLERRAQPATPYRG